MSSFSILSSFGPLSSLAPFVHTVGAWHFCLAAASALCSPRCGDACSCSSPGAFAAILTEVLGACCFPSLLARTPSPTRPGGSHIVSVSQSPPSPSLHSGISLCCTEKWNARESSLWSKGMNQNEMQQVGFVGVGNSSPRMRHLLSGERCSRSKGWMPLSGTRFLFVFLLLPSDHSIQRTSPSLFRKCTSHTLAARVAILLPFFPHHVGPTPSFSAPSCVRCHQSTPSARCIGCRSLPHGTHLSCAQLENRKGVRVSAQPHQPTPHLLHVILHST